jgi:hypothetical protein
MSLRTDEVLFDFVMAAREHSRVSAGSAPALQPFDPRRNSPVPVTVGSKPKRPARTELFWALDRVERYRLCAELVQAAGRVVIVCRNQSDASRVASELSLHGVPSASVEHRDFAAPRVRAQVVTDETALGCVRNGSVCVVQFDPAVTARRYRRRVELLAAPRSVVVTFVVPERVGEARALLVDLGLPDVMSGVDLAVARRALLVAQNAEPPPAAVSDDDRSAGLGAPAARVAIRARAVLASVVRALRDRLPRLSAGVATSARRDQAAVDRDQRAS